MREPAHAASVIRAMVKAVSIPVTVKMRAGWNEREINAPVLAKMAEDAGASALAVHGRTAAQSYTGESDWALIDAVAGSVTIPVFGSGDCVLPEQAVSRLANSRVSGVLIGRGALRNPWIFCQAAAAWEGRSAPTVSLEDRGCFLLEYVDLLLTERVDEAYGFRHSVPSHTAAPPAKGRERGVINKLRALCSWYTKGLDGGAHLRLAINSADSIDALHAIINGFFKIEPAAIETQRLVTRPNYQ